MHDPSERVAPRSAYFCVVPIHLRANPGDYAEACLLPGDPLRAKYIAETFFDDPRQVNGERGLLGFTGTFSGKPVSVQASGMGCPTAAIVIEELAKLGVKKIMRVGTCGGLQTAIGMGELILAMSSTGADSTASHYVLGEPHAPTADFALLHEAVHQAKHLGKKLHVGPIVSSDIFYDPDPGRAQRWSERGHLAIEMEASVLFTLGALRGFQAGCLLLVSDLIADGTFARISDEDLRKAVDEMVELALRVVTA
jgi:purine-nucleoside phosphorylase